MLFSLLMRTWKLKRAIWTIEVLDLTVCWHLSWIVRAQSSRRGVVHVWTWGTRRYKRLLVFSNAKASAGKEQGGQCKKGSLAGPDQLWQGRRLWAARRLTQGGRPSQDGGGRIQTSRQKGRRRGCWELSRVKTHLPTLVTQERFERRGPEVRPPQWGREGSRKTGGASGTGRASWLRP